MKIVINALQYRSNASGIGVMLRELFGRYVQLEDRPCQVLLPGDAPPFPAGPDTELVYAPTRYGSGLRRMAFQTFVAGRRYGHDATLLTTDSKTPFFLPASCRLVTLVTDLAMYRLPQAYQLSRVFWWRLQYCYVRRRADLFLAISEFTKQDLVEILHIPADKIRIVPCACAETIHRVTDADVLAQLRERYGLPPRYILFVGNANPRKNLARVIQAFDRLRTRTELPQQLVIAGGNGWKFDKAQALRGIRHADEVHFLDFVPDADIPALYSAADLFAFPTLYEGFGIPVLEAQTCGVPVLTSNVSALPEVAGQGAVYVDPYSVEDIAEGMRRVLTDSALAAQLVKAGTQNIKRYSWQASARALKEILRDEGL